MNLKQQMQFDAEYYGEAPIYEMAQQHFDNQIVDLIKDGEYEKAAERYIDNHGSAKLPEKVTATTSKLKRGDFAKTLKADAEKVSKIGKEEWDNFENAYSILMGTDKQEKRSYKKTKGTVDSATGKVRTSAQSGSAKGIGLNKLEDKIQKTAAEYQKAMKETEDPEEQEKYKDHLRGLEILGQALQNTKSGKPTLPPATEAEYKKLSAKYEKIGGNAIERLKKLPSAIQGPIEMPDEDDEVIKHATDKMNKKVLSDKGVRVINSIEDEIEDWRMRREMKGRTKTEILPPKMEESMKLSGKILSESLEYQGIDFWTNYVGTQVLKTFNEDVKRYGAKEARDMWCYAFGGKEVAPIFNYMIENTEMLNEASEINGNFLFESVGLKNINNYIIEITPSEISQGSVGGSGIAGKITMGGAKKMGKAGVKKMGKAQKSGLIGWLSGLWGKLKEFGKPLVTRLGSAISQGAKWAKEIAQKGMTFIHENPVARIAVPAIALAGTIAGGITLVNKIRNRAGKDKLSKQEEQKLRSMGEKNQDELKKYGAKVA